MEFRQPAKKGAGDVQIAPAALELQCFEHRGEPLFIRFTVLQPVMTLVGVPKQHIRGIVTVQREAGRQARLRTGWILGA